MEGRIKTLQRHTHQATARHSLLRSFTHGFHLKRKARDKSGDLCQLSFQFVIVVGTSRMLLRSTRRSTLFLFVGNLIGYLGIRHLFPQSILVTTTLDKSPDLSQLPFQLALILGCLVLQNTQSVLHMFHGAFCRMSGTLSLFHNEAVFRREARILSYRVLQFELLHISFACTVVDILWEIVGPCSSDMFGQCMFLHL
ncbi:hypothetical protein B0O80DRAFT_111114 [Mortierella sp. GBAus27b]|nr:hypothetical protein B0O80DRAFT_110978 [Mortierella sp. GBAus27b]KAI8351686.1 hypothetical protein B0O80DRAFT_111114 [Mortierella sp. GBAus27b]